MQENRDDVLEIDLRDLWGALLGRLWLVVASTLLLAGCGFAVSRFAVAPKYESTTSIYIMSRQDSSALTYSDAQLSSQLTKDYEKLVTGRYVLEQVMEAYGLTESYENFAARVAVDNETDTRIIEITVKDKDPSLAQSLADAVREAAAAHIQTVTEVQAVNVAEYANLPLEPSEPSVPLWTALGALAGALLSAGAVTAAFLADDTVKTAEDIEKHLGLSTLALIPDHRQPNGGKGRKKGKKEQEKKQGQPAAPLKEE